MKTIYDNSTTGVSFSCRFYKKLATYDNPYNTTLYQLYNPSLSLNNLTISLGHATGVPLVQN